LFFLTSSYDEINAIVVFLFLNFGDAGKVIKRKKKSSKDKTKIQKREKKSKIK